MRVKSIETIHYDHPIPVYDIISATPYNNFFIDTGKSVIVSHNCGLMDEIDFASGANAKMEQAKIMSVYRNIKRRMESRFQRAGGDLPAMLFMVSSKKSEHDFLEQYISTVKSNPNTYVVDKPLWDVKPDKYCGDKFPVAVGNKYVKSRIVKDDDNIDDLKKQGFSILMVPTEHRSAFELDIDSALMDIAGVSCAVSTKFISYETLSKCFIPFKNPFTTTILSIGYLDKLRIQDFFQPELVPKDIIDRPIFIHLDMSLTGDKTGISGVAIKGAKSNVDTYNKGEVEKSTELFYQQVFSITIECPANSEISLEKNREFIYYLHDELGWNIAGVSADGFQSADTKQQLLLKGYNASILSLDRTPDGYMTFKASLNEKRIGILSGNDFLETEIINLERDNMSGKVDHNDQNSKDTADSLAGALWGASKYKDNYLAIHGEDLDSVLDINSADESTDNLMANSLIADATNGLSKLSMRDAVFDHEIDKFTSTNDLLGLSLYNDTDILI